MKKKIHLIIMVLLASLSDLMTATPYRTSILRPNIKTLQIGVQDEKYSLPIIELNENKNIEIRFDEMSHETHNYNYTVLHCNYDWTLSDLTTNEYLSGYIDGYITEFNQSINTNYLYTNYRLTLPNDNMQFKISGNYVVIIYEDNIKDKPIAQACFSIVEPKVEIKPTIRYNTDIEINGRYQQLDFEVLLNSYSVRDPMTEIKTVVRQNNRLDNEVLNITSNYISNTKLTFVNNKSLIFEGGNEFHNFDISSVYAAGRGVDKIVFKGSGYNAYLFKDKIQIGNYLHDYDANGRFIINNQEAFEDVHTESDYVLVHFELKTPSPFFDGKLYLGGEFNYNLFDSNNLLQFNNFDETYSHTLLLKQGGYNYQYLFVPKGSTKATSTRVDGSYWQTQNEYTIYVYHRGWGERYDKLIGVIISD
ncbi:MAG: hypothetical protein BGO29_03515 [Bacteroidales bacterium 36-12]|nr:MAG: hypothetical protein BGO29_03515 [Bacteroidales bacterium 36-12]